MLTVHEVSRLTGVSIRTLHYYDKIGLLHPTQITKAGYRLYDDTNVERLQHILLFRKLQFPLKDIKKILDSENFDRNQALDQQIMLLELQKEQLENLIEFARGIRKTGVRNLDFTAFDTKKIDAYVEEAKAKWGQTPTWQEFEKKNNGRTKDEAQNINEGLMEIFKGFGRMLENEPTDDRVQRQVKKLQDYITDYFYTCTDEILYGLGQMYVSDDRMTENINKEGGEGTAEFVNEAIKIYCGK